MCSRCVACTIVPIGKSVRPISEPPFTGGAGKEDDALAKPAAKRKAPAKSTSPAKDDEFILHSLQEAYEKSRRYDASDDELLTFYEQMLLIRRFEEKAGQLYGLGLIGGFCHLYIGQEAVAVGLQSALKEGLDSVITGYRDHGHMLAYGIDPNIIMTELTGRQAGISKGKGGSMHMFSTEHRFYGGHGIVGAQVPLGAGLAFAHKYNEDGGVCLAYFGDGAANQGQVYETFNMASLWQLPIVFVIENNQYAMGTSTARSSAETEFYRRGTAFRIPGMDVNGMDVLEVRAAAEIAVAHVREGKGPVLMELNTYRYRGHSMSDPAKYRSREEVQDVREHKDPIEGLKKVLMEKGKTEEELKAIDKQIRSVVAQAADFAENSPEPEPSELYTDVLVENY
jgi:pyruvate dehydrogenase E1 component alpha subunit